MNKILISTLVGAIILFVFQASSWMFLGIHDHSFKYTPSQDSIMPVLSTHLEEGMYFLPFFDKATTSEEEQQKIHEANAGKPWAMITYHNEMEMDMGKTMGLGFLSDFLVCLLISLVLINIPASTFSMRMFLVMCLAALVMLGGPLYQANWFDTPTHYLSGELIDILGGYFLAGLWMSWWTGRN